MNWLDTSEIVFGLVLDGHIQPEFVEPRLIHPPYEVGINIYKDTRSLTSVVDKIGLDPVRSAKDAAASVDKTWDWTELLRKSAGREQLAGFLEGMSKSLRKGDDIDYGSLASAIDRTITQKNDRYISLDLVEPSEESWILTGYEPIDFHMGGVPANSLTIIAGPPGTGKTSLMLEIAGSAARLLKKKSLIYTFEMTTRQIVARLIQTNPGITKEDRRYLVACEDVLTIDEVYADASRIVATEPGGFQYICMDFADLMLEREEDEQSVGYIYRKCATLAKKTGAQVLLISQLSRAYVGGLPRVHHIRWSGLAEAMAAMILLLYNPNQIFANQGRDERLPIVPGHGYIIQGKSRFGYKSGQIGAVQVEWDGKVAWGHEALGWYFL